MVVFRVIFYLLLLVPFLLLVLWPSPLFVRGLWCLLCSGRRPARFRVRWRWLGLAVRAGRGCLLAGGRRGWVCRWRCGVARCRCRWRFLLHGRTGSAVWWSVLVACVALCARWGRLGWCAVLSFSSFSAVGFSGSRSLSGVPFFRCVTLAGSAVAAGCAVSTGCAGGADAAARAGACGSVQVFAVASGRWGRGRGAFAGRSAAFVQVFGWRRPHRFWSRFRPVLARRGWSLVTRWPSGFGSGSWAGVALAVGLGVPVVVFLPPAVAPPAGWGAWSAVSGWWVLSGGW